MSIALAQNYILRRVMNRPVCVRAQAASFAGKVTAATVGPERQNLSSQSHGVFFLKTKTTKRSWAMLY